MADPTTEFDYDQLDPGIRDIVRRVRAAGFETVDSGDGVSKPASWYQPDEHGFSDALPYPHVACRVEVDDLVAASHRLAAVLDGWAVQASYDPADQSSILLATKQADTTNG